MAKSFTRGGYSFRPTILWKMGVSTFAHIASPKGARTTRAIIYTGSDGQSCVVSMVGFQIDARPSFKEACDLVMARLPREGA